MYNRYVPGESPDGLCRLNIAILVITISSGTGWNLPRKPPMV
jgi:hypothetical protein